MRLSRSNYMIASQGNLKSPGCSFIKVKPGFRRTWKFWKYGLFVASSGKLGKFQIKKKIVKFFVATNSLIFWLLNKLLVNTMIFLSNTIVGEGWRGYTEVDTPGQGKRVKIGRKSVVALYGWWSTHFLLVRNSGGNYVFAAPLRKMTSLFEWKLRKTQGNFFWTFLSETWKQMAMKMAEVLFLAIFSWG